MEIITPTYLIGKFGKCRQRLLESFQTQVAGLRFRDQDLSRLLPLLHSCTQEKEEKEKEEKLKSDKGTK